MTTKRDMARPLGPHGFTLIELMSALAIVGTIAAIAIPSGYNVLQNARRASIVNDLVLSVARASAEAVSRGDTVAICPLGPGGGNACAPGADWSAGWIIFPDPEEDGVRGAAPVLARYAHGESGFRVTAGLARAAGRPAGVEFLRPAGHGNGNGTFTVCDRRGAAQARAVIVSIEGTPRISDRRADGGALSCS